MLIDLKTISSQDGCTKDMTADIEMTHFKRSRGEHYKLVKKSPLTLHIHNEGNQVLLVEGDFSVACQMACARCLKRLEESFDISFSYRYDPKVVDEEEDESEIACCISEDMELDADILVHNELLIHWPIRVLCDPDCRGICPKCGQDLNEGECGCSRFSPDPRMAAISELFSNNKEV